MHKRVSASISILYTITKYELHLMYLLRGLRELSQKALRTDRIGNLSAPPKDSFYLWEGVTRAHLRIGGTQCTRGHSLAPPFLLSLPLFFCSLFFTPPLPAFSLLSEPLLPVPLLPRLLPWAHPVLWGWGWG